MRVFSLLLVCCALAACGELNPDPQARAAAHWALDRGGTVRVFGEPSVITDPGLLPSGAFALEAINMNELSPGANRVSDKELEVLKGLTNIRKLGLYGSSVTDAGCEIISTLKTLHELELSQSQITDTGLAQLATLPNLEKLFIRNVGEGVTDEGVKAFKSRSDAAIYR